VPILIDLDGTVLDESMDIMFWALLQNDPDKWLALVDQSALLIEKNDFEFKPWLDKYKYSVGYPEHTQSYYRDKSGEFLDILNSRLSANTYLIDQHVRLADIAIFPFIRQFAFVDKAWFDDAPYPKLKNWLDYWLESPLFNSVMQKHPIWQEGNTGIAC
jgi:glutathione S-transferase